MIEPEHSQDEDGQAGGDAGGDAVAEAGGEEAEFAGEEAGACCGKRIRKQETTGGTEELSDASEAVGAEDGEPGCAFGEVKHHGGETCDGTEDHADQYDGEGLKRERHDREREREVDVRTEGDELGRGDREDNPAEQ